MLFLASLYGHKSRNKLLSLYLPPYFALHFRRLHSKPPGLNLLCSAWWIIRCAIPIIVNGSCASHYCTWHLLVLWATCFPLAVQARRKCTRILLLLEVVSCENLCNKKFAASFHYLNNKKLHRIFTFYCRATSALYCEEAQKKPGNKI